MQSPSKPEISLRCEISEFGEGNRLLFFSNVTELRQLEQMRVDFIANVSHELRTPLTVISGYLENLAEMPAVISSDTMAKAIRQMREQSSRMEHLVADLMLLSRLESVSAGAFQSVNIAALIQGILESAAVKLGQEKNFSVLVDDDLEVLDEERELYSAFSNLVNNACKNTATGGQVSLSWRARADGGAEFCVRDNGIGIDPVHIPRLTERFYRVDKSRSIASGGTGLGLAIVKHVLLRHDAELRISSEPGEGSNFCCIFGASSVRPAGLQEQVSTAS